MTCIITTCNTSQKLAQSKQWKEIDRKTHCFFLLCVCLFVCEEGRRGERGDIYIYMILNISYMLCIYDSKPGVHRKLCRDEKKGGMKKLYYNIEFS